MATIVVPDTVAGRPWTAVSLIYAAAIAAVAGVCYWTVLADLASEWWNDSAASYGILIPPLTAWITWLRRREILSIPAAPDLRGLWLTALGCFLLVTGKLAAEFFLTRVSFVVVLAGVVWTWWGAARFRRLVFPFILLATMVPLPSLVYNAVAAPLQLFASRLAANIADALGVSVFRDGNIIHLPEASLGVEEACSGLRSLSAMVIAALLLGFVEGLPAAGRVLLCLWSVPLAIAINVLRIAGTALIADHHLEYALGFYHAFSGWLVFLAGFGLLWLSATIPFRRMRLRL